MGLEVPLLLLLAAAIVAAPILAIVAFLRTVSFERATRARLDRLEQRVAALGRGVGQPTESGAPAQPPSTPVARPLPDAAEASAAPPPPFARATVRPASATPSRPDLETLIAGRWLNRIGVVALLLAAAFFLKLAFDNDWVGPRGRVAIGLLAGAALMVWGQRLFRRGFRYFSEGITGLGAGVIYLSVYAAWGFYALVHQAPAFAGTIVVTAALTALAVGRDSERLAVLALAGGLLTPGLFRTGEDPQVVLFSYLTVLVAALAVLLHFRDWRTLEPLALGGVVFHFASWFDQFYEASAWRSTLAWATLLFLGFALPAVLRARRGRLWRAEQIALGLANVGWFVVALHALLYRERRWGLTLAVLALALGYVASAGLMQRSATTRLARLLFAGLALTLVTIAIPIRLEGRWIVMAWAVEGAVLVWSGLRADNRALRGAGLVLLALTLWLLAAQPMSAPRVLLNARFATFATTVTAFAVAGLLALRRRPPLAAAERPLFQGLGVLVHAIALWALSLEVWDFAAGLQLGADRELGQQLGLSLLWALYATGLVVAGVRLGTALLRWQGLVLIGIVTGKVFLADLSFLERGFRILSFCALGALLLVVSFLYQRRLAEGRGEERR